MGWGRLVTGPAFYNATTTTMKTITLETNEGNWTATILYSGLYFQDAAVWFLNQIDKYSYTSIVLDDDADGTDMMEFVNALIGQVRENTKNGITSSLHPMRQYIAWYESGNCTGKLTDFESYRAYEVSKIHLGTFAMDMHGQVVVSKPSWWKYLTGETE